MGKRRGGAGVERRQWGWPVLATASAAGPEVALWRAEPDPVEGLPPEPVMGSLAAVVAAPCDVLPGPVAVSEVLARPSDVLPDGLDPLPGTSTGAPRRSSSSSCSVALDERDVDAARRGEARAWEDAYRAYGKALMGFLVVRLGDAEEAAEALSETFLRAIEKSSSFRGDALSFRAWLYTIARNVATDRLRVRGRTVPVADPGDFVDQLRPGPLEGTIGSEDAAEVRRAFAQLPPDDQEVLWLRVCSGLGAAEVGHIVGKRPGAVRMQQLRSLEAMARRMGR